MSSGLQISNGQVAFFHPAGPKALGAEATHSARRHVLLICQVAIGEIDDQKGAAVLALVVVGFLAGLEQADHIAIEPRIGVAPLPRYLDTGIG